MNTPVLLNGHLMPANAVRLPLPNRGLYFNDGFFETMIWSAGGIRYLPYHMSRMQRAANVLGLVLPQELSTTENLKDTLRQLADNHNMHSEIRIRLQLWRSGGGLYTPETGAVEWLATSQLFQPHAAPITTCEFAETIRTHAASFSFCKGPNTLTYVLAAQERQQRGLDEVILLSEAGYIAETVAAAVAWIRNNTIYTPSEAVGCVTGTRLAHLQKVAMKQGIEWREGKFFPNDLLEAEAIFTANVAGIRAVQQVQRVPFDTEKHPVFMQLLAAEQISA